MAEGVVGDISHEGLRIPPRDEGVSFQAVKTWKASAGPGYEAKKARVEHLYAIADVMYALEPDYRRRLWPVLAGSLEASGLLVFTWQGDGGPPAPRLLKELGSRRVGRHTYTVLSEILDAGGEACRARYVHRITEGGKVIGEEELTGYAYRPPRNELERELVTAGFAQAGGAEGLLAWRLA